MTIPTVRPFSKVAPFLAGSGQDRIPARRRHSPSVRRRCRGRLQCGAATAVIGGPVPMAILLVGGLGIALVGRPEIAIPIFAFAFYLNLPTLATRFHGVPGWWPGCSG